MSDQYVDFAKSQMGAIERLLKGLPGINGYIDKELRRDADKNVRMGLAQALDHSKAELMSVQSRLLDNGGLMFMDDVDRSVVKLQTLIDRIKTAAYGYAGLFDPVRVKEAQLDALNRFDVAMVNEVGKINEAISALSAAVGDNDKLGPTATRLKTTIDEASRLFDKRKDAITNPDLLNDMSYAPPAAPPAAAAPAQPAAPAAATSSPQASDKPATLPSGGDAPAAAAPSGTDPAI